jgi:hypothetical protein
MVLALAVLTIFLTQSKLSLLAVTAIILFYVYRNSQSKEEFHVKHWKFFIIILISAIVFVSLFLLRADIVQSYKTRIYQYSIQQNISTNTSIGSGIGTYRISYNPNISSKDLWNYEPVHFVPYIVIKEMGIVGLIILLAATSIYIGRVPHGTFQQHYLMYAFLLFILVIDHFAWDIHQGQSILFFGLLLATLDIDKRLN